MSKKKSKKIKPTLTWESGLWITEQYLPSWCGTQSRRGPYGGKDKSESSDGISRLMFCADNEETPPADYQLSAYNYLIENEKEIYTSIIEALLIKYPSIYEMYNDFVKENGGFIPKTMNATSIKNHIGLSNIYFIEEELDSIGYIGFELGCTWEIEHGLGIMTHKQKILEIDDAETAWSNRSSIHEVIIEEKVVVKKKYKW